MGNEFSVMVKTKRNDYAHDIRKAIDMLIFSLDGKGEESSNGDDSAVNQRAAAGSFRATFLFHLLRSCHEGTSVGEEMYQPLLLLLFGAVLLSRKVAFKNPTTGTKSVVKIDWNVDPNNIADDPFVFAANDDVLTCGELSQLPVYSAKAKYHLNEKMVCSVLTPTEVSFIRFVARGHISTNFGQESSGNTQKADKSLLPSSWPRVTLA